jgi:hypothetical protein
MRQLTPEGRRIVEDLAQRHRFSAEAVTAMLMAVVAGGGSKAQFDHPEFGGMGQWSQGGMTMIGDMFNNALKARVDGLCAELVGLLARQPLTPQPMGGQSQSQSGFAAGGGGGEVSLFVPITGRSPGGWWPADLGQPSSTGQQNDIRYAVFPAARRLAIDIAGRLSVYDTLDHQIGGISQQQSGDASLSFTSQHGLVRLSELPVVAGDAPAPSRQPAAAPATPPPAARPPSEPFAAASQPAPPPPVPAPPASPPPAAPAAPPPHPVPAAESADEIFAVLERLAELHGKGILSEDEFATKKAELLARL